MNKPKCLNFEACHNHATDHSGLCQECRRAAMHLDGNVEEVNFDEIVWRQVEREAKRKDKQVAK